MWKLKCWERFPLSFQMESGAEEAKNVSVQARSEVWKQAQESGGTCCWCPTSVFGSIRMGQVFTGTGDILFPEIFSAWLTEVLNSLV